MTSSDYAKLTDHSADDVVDPAAAMIRLERCLELLTATGAEQQRLFENEAVRPEIVAAGFDRAYVTAQRIAAGAFTPEQTDAMDRVAEKLLTISRDGSDFDADLWTDAAVRTSPHWREVRTLAAAALEALRRTR